MVRLLPVLLLALGLLACSEETPVGGDSDVTTDDDPGGKPDGVGEVDAGAPDADDGGPELPAGDVDAGPDAPGDAGPDVPSDVEADVPLPQCDPALSVEPASAIVLPFDLLVLAPSGGAGAYRFELVEDGSGGLVNELTGTYLAGEVAGVVDRVRLTDDGCQGSAEAEITVAPLMQILPEAPTVPPGTSFDYQVVGGSGDVVFELLQSEGGATVSSAGAYAAGGEGLDRIRATDQVTGQVVDVDVIVDGSVSFEAAPPLIFVSVGSTHRPTVSGGSGYFEVSPANDAVFGDTEVEGELAALASGETTVTLTDVFTGQSTTLTAQAVESRSAPFERTGDGTSWEVVATPGDLDGDGYADALLALLEADVTGYQAGAVFVYSGVDGGLAEAPAQIIGGEERRDFFGRAMVVVDLDADGDKDLVVGASHADVGATDNGAVYVFRGLPGGFFEPEASRTFFGIYGGDQIGYGIAACDFNADGLVDLALGAPNHENRDLDPDPSNQGAVLLYLGREDGFLASPDLIVYGKVPVGGGAWEDDDGIRLGAALAAGDFDGDGACDLAAHADAYRSAESGRNNDGAVYIYRGVPAEGQDPGGIDPTPAWAAAGIDADSPSSRFGRELAMGDVDGDGKADLLVGQYAHHAGETGNIGDAGQATLWLGGAFPDQVNAFAAPSDADWSVEGDNGTDYYGWAVKIEDADGSLPLDLVVGHLLGEAPEQPSNTGLLAVYYGVEGGLPATEADVLIIGTEGSPRFGGDVGALGDANGDGVTDYMVFAARDDTFGYEVGRPYFVSGDGGLIGLDLPGQPSGSELGRGADVAGDLDGDGFPDLVVGAPEADNPDQGVACGSALLYRGSANGFSTEPDLEWKGFVRHSGSDRFGYAVSRAGDFDGDGNDDVAIVARYEDRPASDSFPDAMTPDGACGGSLNNDGAVLVFSGSASGLPDAEPAFVWYSPEANDSTEEVLGGLDINGDGLDDLVATGRLWDDKGNDSGGFMVAFGRARVPGQTAAICGEDYLFYGAEGGGHMGRSLARLGDLDGDGCEDFAVGGYLIDQGVGNQGAVRVVFGWGGAGCPGTPDVVMLVPEDSGGAQSGYGLAGGGDVDGDGLGDLVVGGINLNVNGITGGGIWLVPGSYLLSLPRAKLASGQIPALHPYVPSDALLTFRLSSPTAGARMGTDVALVPGALPGGKAAIAVGAPLGDYAGTSRSGGVVFFGAAPEGGLDPAPLAVFGGESYRGGGRIGERVNAGTLANGTPVVVVGGYDGSAVGLDQGSVYVLRWP